MCVCVLMDVCMCVDGCVLCMLIVIVYCFVFWLCCCVVVLFGLCFD